MQRRERLQHFARIRVVGVGDGGSRAVERLMAEPVGGVDFISVDTDPPSPSSLYTPTHICVDRQRVRRAAATADLNARERVLKDSATELRQLLHNSDLVFITGGLGGETGSCLAPVVAGIAREMGALTIGIVSLPFCFEGTQRTQVAEAAVRLLRQWVDTLIAIPNDRLLEIANGQISFHETSRLTDAICRQSIRGISEIVNVSGLINVDFADVRSIIAEGGGAIITSGSGRGENRARQAAEMATVSEWLGVAIDGARGVLFTVSGGPDMSLQEVGEAARIITARTDPDANVILGTTIDARLGDEMRITLIATGVGDMRIRPEVRPDLARPSFQPTGISASDYVRELLLENVTLERFPNRAERWSGTEATYQ